jgi:hypothetical protein
MLLMGVLLVNRFIFYCFTVWCAYTNRSNYVDSDHKLHIFALVYLKSHIFAYFEKIIYKYCTCN